MLPFLAKANPHALIVGMTGVKMGDRLLQVGCSDGGALAAVAGKVGLSGRAVALVPDASIGARARKGAEQQGVHIEIEIAQPTAMPFDEAAFDLVVVDNAANQFAALDADTQVGIVREIVRVLHPGGRVLVISALPASGLSALLGRGSTGPAFDPSSALEAGGCRFVRVLGEREGLRFTEGTKARP
jgi:ubiquinone/menaquinone biosynthesis C-methylase UbiE